jgi:uncharacterized cofD-like protein
MNGSDTVIQSSVRQIVLFSGGTASNLLARSLEETGCEIVNVIAVFDNGGSSGALRRVKPMPAMGDIRNRLVALAPGGDNTRNAIRDLFNWRFSERKAESQLRQELQTFADALHPAMLAIPSVPKGEIMEAIGQAIYALPESFPLQDLSLGNLLLCGRTLKTGDFIEAIEWARRLLAVRSQVLPVTVESAHIGALCEGGYWVLGQWAITHESVGLPGQVESIHLLEREDSYAFTVTAHASDPVMRCLNTADAFILGFGSFLTSILSHFLVKGVGTTFLKRSVPKILLCNPTIDKETKGCTIESLVRKLTHYATLDDTDHIGNQPVITHILHFGPDEKTRIPAGNCSALQCEYVDFFGLGGPNAIAARACERMSYILRLDQPNMGFRTSRVKSDSRPHIFLFDLDTTLFNYTDLRRDATAAALAGTVKDPMKTSAELLELLRPPLTDVLMHLNFCDLRRKWDSPGMFTLARVLEDTSLREYLLQIADKARNLCGNDEQISFAYMLKTYKFARELERSSSAVPLLDAIVQAEDLALGSLKEKQGVFQNYVLQNTFLATGVKDVISSLMVLGAEIHVVSEGDSTVQMFKFNSLGLEELVRTCLVTDMTYGVLPVIAELFATYKDMDVVPEHVEALYDQLVPYSIKSRAFYAKMLHALADETPDTALLERIKSTQFLTDEEWRYTRPMRIVMVGDRYRKDLEPLLRVAPKGVRAYRVLGGRYYGEDPLHELIDQQRPLPHGVFPDIAAMGVLLVASVEEPIEEVIRPLPVLPDVNLLEEVMRICDDLSEAARTVLLNIRSEVLRHKGA